MNRLQDTQTKRQGHDGTMEVVMNRTWTMRLALWLGLLLLLGSAGCGSDAGNGGSSSTGDGFTGVNPVPTPGGGGGMGGDAGATDGWSGAVDTATWANDDSSGGSDAGGDASDAAQTGGNTGLSQVGAQDFGLFRQILEDGAIPAPSTIDDMGFFAEHKLDYPDPTCGQDVCMHALLGEMGNLITGTVCTLMQIGLNTPIQVDATLRAPLHLVLAIDTSDSMKGQPLEYVRQGLTQMLDALQPEDHVTLVTFDGAAKVVFEHLGKADKATMQKAILSLAAGKSTNLYDGLFTAFAKASKHHAAAKAAGKAVETRVLLLSDGLPTAGITAVGKFVALAEGYASEGIGITTVGVGKAFAIDVLRDIAELGAGNFYFLDQPAAVKEVFTEEVKTFLVPVALDVEIDVEVGDYWIVRAGYGTNGWKAAPGGGTIRIPSLFLAGRLSADDPLPTAPGTGRRGGGGAILIEAMPFPGMPIGTTEVGKVKLRWKHPKTGKIYEQKTTIDKQKAKVQIADGGIFENATVEKGFVMLNLYAGFVQAATLATEGDVGAALGALGALRKSVSTWIANKKKSGKTADPDIEDDLYYVDLFIANLQKVASKTPVTAPPEPWPPWPKD